MNIEKLPLAERLQRITNGYPAHIEYNVCAIQNMAHTSIAVYLHGFESERARLMELVEPWGASDDMSYQQMAAFVRDLRRIPNERGLADEAAALLAAPLLHCFRRREADYGRIDQTAAE